MTIINVYKEMQNLLSQRCKSRKMQGTELREINLVTCFLITVIIILKRTN